MRKVAKVALVLPWAVVLASVPGRAQSAPTPPDGQAPAAAHAGAHPVSVAALGGYSLNGASDTGQTGNMFGAGFGARAGYASPGGIYGGLGFLYDLGYSKSLGQGATASSRLTLLGLEAGYELRFDAFTVRPMLGLGLALYSSSQNGPAPTFIQGKGTKPALWPGVVATYDATDRLFVGIDLRYTIVWSGAESYDVAPAGGAPEAFGAFGQIGVRI